VSGKEISIERSFLSSTACFGGRLKNFGFGRDIALYVRAPLLARVVLGGSENGRLQCL